MSMRRVDLIDTRTGQVYEGWEMPTLVGFTRVTTPEQALEELQKSSASWRNYAIKAAEQRCALDWNKPAVWNPFPGFVVESDAGDAEDGTWHATKSGALGRSTGSTDDGRSTFVNPLLRG